MTREATPTDQMSGLPLLIAPEERVLSMLWGYEPRHNEDGQALADWNHVWHPSRAVVDAGAGGPALRNSRVQFVLRQEQHDEYHAYYDGPVLPSKPSERFSAAVLCAAGYIPMQAIQFETDGPKIVNLAPAQREQLRESGEVRVASFSVVQRFMKEFVLAQPVDHIKPKTIDRFLKIDSSAGKSAAREQAYLAHLLLSLAIDRVEDTLMGPYAIAHEAELLYPGVPGRADLFVLSSIVRSHKNVRGIVKDLTKKLTVHRDGQEKADRHSTSVLAAA